MPDDGEASGTAGPGRLHEFPAAYLGGDALATRAMWGKDDGKRDDRVLEPGPEAPEMAMASRMEGNAKRISTTRIISRLRRPPT